MRQQAKICTSCGIEKDIDEFDKRGAGVRGQCKLCRSFKTKEYYRKNAERLKSRRKKYYKIHKAKILALDKKYYQENAERIKTRYEKHRKNHKVEIKVLRKKYYRQNVEKVKAWCREYRRTHKKERNAQQKQRRRTDPMFRLNDNITSAIGQSLKGNKNGRHWENLTGYTLDVLKRHLEKQFIDNMSWENYGFNGWVIDHKTPISVFNFTKPEHKDFKRCWALSNLQPMWFVDNCSKGAKINQHFQPSLLM